MVKTIYTHTVKLSPDKGGKLGRLALTDVSISSAVSFLRFFLVIVLNSSLFFSSDVVFELPSSWLLSAMFHLFIESLPPELLRNVDAITELYKHLKLSLPTVFDIHR